MSKKLFASDYDGTFYISPDGVKNEYLDAVARFREAGNLFGIITGRSYDSAMEIFRKYSDHLDFFMCMNGAYAIDRDRNVIFRYMGDGSVIYPMMKLFSETGCIYLNYSVDEATYGFDEKVPLTEEDVAGMKKHDHFTQICTAFSESILDEMVEKIRAEFGDKVSIQLNGCCVDLPPFGVTKGNSVRRMAEHFGVSPENVFTAGDNNNDVSMLEGNYGYTLPHGTDAAKAAAKKILNNIAEMIGDVMNNH